MPDPRRITEAENQLADAVAILLAEGESPSFIREDVDNAIAMHEDETPAEADDA